MYSAVVVVGGGDDVVADDVKIGDAADGADEVKVYDADVAAAAVAKVADPRSSAE